MLLKHLHYNFRIPVLDHTTSLCARIHPLCSPWCARLLSLGSRMQEPFSWNGLEFHIDFLAISPKIPYVAIFYCLVGWLVGCDLFGRCCRGELRGSGSGLVRHERLRGIQNEVDLRASQSRWALQVYSRVIRISLVVIYGEHVGGNGLLTSKAKERHVFFGFEFTQLARRVQPKRTQMEVQ